MKKDKKDRQGQDIKLMNPHTLKEIIVKYGTKEWVNAMKSSVMRRMIKLEEERKSQYSKIELDIAESIYDVLKTKYETVMPAMFFPEKRPLTIGVFIDKENGEGYKKYSIKIQEVQDLKTAESLLK